MAPAAAAIAGCADVPDLLLLHMSFHPKDTGSLAAGAIAAPLCDPQLLLLCRCTHPMGMVAAAGAAISAPPCGHLALLLHRRPVPRQQQAPADAAAATATPEGGHAWLLLDQPCEHPRGSVAIGLSPIVATPGYPALLLYTPYHPRAKVAAAAAATAPDLCGPLLLLQHRLPGSGS